MNLTTAAPAEIDTVLAELEAKAAKAEQHLEWAVEALHVALGETQVAVRLPSGRRERHWATTTAQAEAAAAAFDPEHHRARKVTEAVEKLAAKRAEVARIAAEIAPITAEWVRRGGWTRAFLVKNHGGHIHRDRACPTCFPSTQYAWLPQVSGLDEADIVTQAGEMACTVCYPSAPVETRGMACILEDPATAAEKAAVKAEKAARAAAKAAKAITNPDGTALRHEYGVVATERAAEIEAVKGLADALFYGRDGQDHPSAPRWREFADQAAVALAHKRGEPVEDVKAALEVKAQAKFVRDLKAAEKHAKEMGW